MNLALAAVVGVMLAASFASWVRELYRRGRTRPVPDPHCCFGGLRGAGRTHLRVGPAEMPPRNYQV